MSCVCLWSPVWSTGEGPSDEVTASLLEVVPRVVVERRGVVWADGRGLPAARVAGELLDRLGGLGVGAVWAGVALVPVAAELAARAAAVAEGAGARKEVSGAWWGEEALRAPDPVRVEGRVWVVEAGREREFMAPLPLSWLEPEPLLAVLFAGVGLERVGDLAVLSREAVEVRFGAEAVGLWRLARADDRRRLFGPIPPERPHASIDFIDYVVTDPERLIFTANALLGSLEEELRSRGEHARRIGLALSLADGRVWRRVLRPARPTASRETWLRLVRAVLDRAELPDAVTGVALQVEATEPAGVHQGDLFDRGFATAAAVEAAIARLIEAQGPVFVEPEPSAHPLPERRVAWIPGDPLGMVGRGEGTKRRPHRAGRRGRAEGDDDGPRGLLEEGDADRRGEWGARGAGRVAESVRAPGRSGAESAPGAAHLAVVPVSEPDTPPPGARLTLQLLPEPRAVEVEATWRRDHLAPVRFHDGRGWHQLVTVSGPDRISGGRWEMAYAREYFRCVTAEGVLVWLFRDARRGGWYVHGWWD